MSVHYEGFLAFKIKHRHARAEKMILNGDRKLNFRTKGVAATGGTKKRKQHVREYWLDKKSCVKARESVILRGPALTGIPTLPPFMSTKIKRLITGKL